MKKILIVDDDANVLDLFRLSFNDEEVKNIDFTDNGEEAIRLLDTKRYDKVICDFRLNGKMDGFQILRRARERGVHVRVLLTAVSSMLPLEGTAVTCAFRKPCDSERIRSWVLTDSIDTKMVTGKFF